jgi:hypothetical protein
LEQPERNAISRGASNDDRRRLTGGEGSGGSGGVARAWEFWCGYDYPPPLEIVNFCNDKDF